MKIQNQQNQQNQSLQELRKSPNLFDPTQYPKTLEEKIRPKAVYSLKVYIFSIIVIFLFLLVANIRIQSLIRSESIENIKLRSSNRGLLSTKEKLISFGEDIQTYKDLKASFNNYGKIIENVIALKPAGFNIEKYSVSMEKFTIIGKVKSPPDFAIYAENIFSKTSASEIVLNLASYNADENDFSISFEVIL